MFIEPTPGSMICHDGRQLLFHSAPRGLWQYEDLESGEVFKWNHKEFRDAARDGTVVKIVTTGSATTIAFAQPLPSQHQAMLIGLTDFETSEQARFAHAFMAFQRSGLDLKTAPDQVLAAVEAACAELKFKPVTIGQLRGIQARYRRHRDVLYACTPQRRGPRAGTYLLDKRDEALVDDAIENHYLKLEQPSIASAFRHYLRLREDDQRDKGQIAGFPASQRTFERRVARLESFYKVERRHGLPEAKRLHRLVRGIYSNVRPMEVGEMDDCYIPVMVISDDYSHALGTPRLCHVRDRGTGYVPSFFLWCGEVSTFTALATFRNQLSDKAPLLRNAGLDENAWPYCGTFETIVMDRGPNLDAEAVVRAGTAMGSAVQICPVKMPWAKPFVERLHGHVLEYIAKELPGRTFDDLVSFRAYKSKVKAIIPLSALIRLLVQFFVEVINGVPRTAQRPTPTQMMSAWLLDHPPAVPCDPARIELLTSMPIQRVVNQEGVRWKNLHFVSDDLEALVRRIGHGVNVTMYVKLKHSRLIDSRCVLEISDYSEKQRAEILYNHIYFSDLPDEYRAALLAGRFYKDIVKHQKFNPRLVDWLSSFQRVKSTPPERYRAFVQNLLADPVEIWRHAYEQQVSDAARSVLLALYTYSGKCGPAPLERAFRALHALRAQRYGFKTEPSDWRRALGELNGSFIRPGNQIEVIDPSVLDMLNAVVRQDTSNALDMIEGSVRFEQARRIWTFAFAEGSSEVLNHLASESAKVAAAFEHLLAAPRKVAIGTSVSYFDDSIELRVGTVIQVAEALQSDGFSRVVASAIDALVANWKSEPVNIDDGVALLTALQNCTLDFHQLSNSVVRMGIVRALVIEASTGCRSDQLRGVLDAVDFEDLDEELNGRLNTAAQIYRERYFSDELRECKSVADYDALEEDLGAIAESTNLNFEGAIHAVVEAKAEFEDQQLAYEDQKYDEWKEQRYDMQADDRALDDLFDSLHKPD